MGWEKHLKPEQMELLKRLSIENGWLEIDGEPMGNDEEPIGIPGPKGDKGDQGDQGPAGESAFEEWTVAGGTGGWDGFMHSLTGPKGDTGEQGPKGDKGDTGPAGPKGDTGLTGPAGVKGDTGSTGAKGDTGAVGPKGDTGATGSKGDTGSQGPSGAIVTPYRKRLQTNATGLLSITFPTPFAAIPAIGGKVENANTNYTTNFDIVSISNTAITLQVVLTNKATFSLLGLTNINIAGNPTSAMWVHLTASEQS